MSVVNVFTVQCRDNVTPFEAGFVRRAVLNHIANQHPFGLFDAKRFGQFRVISWIITPSQPRVTLPDLS